MQPVTNLALQVTEIHPVIGFQVTDEGRRRYGAG
jgi:hypothetical protein